MWADAWRKGKGGKSNLGPGKPGLLGGTTAWLPWRNALRRHPGQTWKLPSGHRGPSEIKLRAMRRMGGLLGETERAKGGNPNLSTPSAGSSTLPELGVTRYASKPSQMIDAAQVLCLQDGSYWVSILLIQFPGIRTTFNITTASTTTPICAIRFTCLKLFG